MVRRTPGSAGTDVVANGCVFLALIRNTEDVRNGRHAATAGAACSPGIGLPRDDCAILFRRDFHASVSGRPGTRNFELRITLEHHADGLAASLLGNFRS